MALLAPIRLKNVDVGERFLYDAGARDYDIKTEDLENGAVAHGYTNAVSETGVHFYVNPEKVVWIDAKKDLEAWLNE